MPNDLFGQISIRIFYRDSIVLFYPDKHTTRNMHQLVYFCFDSPLVLCTCLLDCRETAREKVQNWFDSFFCRGLKFPSCL